MTRVLTPPADHRLIRRDAGRLDSCSGQPGAVRRTGPRPVLGSNKCAVEACLRARRRHRGRQQVYCALHASRWETEHQAARDTKAEVDELAWRAHAEPIPVPGQVNLRALAPLVVVQVLYGVQQRARENCATYCRFLRRLVTELRQTQVASLAELPRQDERARRALANSLLLHLGRAFADPRTEVVKDVWDLTVLGHHGRLTFTGISQNWLRQTAKGWACRRTGSGAERGTGKRAEVAAADWTWCLDPKLG